MALDQTLLATLKEKLLAEKTRLESELGRFASSTGTEGSYETRMGDMGTDEDENASEVEEYVDNLGLEQNLEAQLKEVHDALAKMDAGTYGVCEETGKEIDSDRLMAYPAARTAL